MKKMFVAVLMFLSSVCFAETQLLKLGNDSINIPDLNLYSSALWNVTKETKGIGAFVDVLRWKALDLSGGYAKIENIQYGSIALKLSLDKLDQFGIKNVEYILDNYIKVSPSIWIGYNFENNITDDKRFVWGLGITILKIESK